MSSQPQPPHAGAVSSMRDLLFELWRNGRYGSDRYTSVDFIETRLEALMQQRELEAQIKEVKQLNSLNHRHHMSEASKAKVHRYIADRIEELETQLEELTDAV